MKLDLNKVLNTKVEIPTIVEPEQPTLTSEQFKELTSEVEKLKLHIEKGEQLSVKEAAKITVWFRARRVVNFTVVAKAKAAKAKAKVPAKRKRLTAEDKQVLGDALIAGL